MFGNFGSSLAKVTATMTKLRKGIRHYNNSQEELGCCNADLSFNYSLSIVLGQASVLYVIDDEEFLIQCQSEQLAKELDNSEPFDAIWIQMFHYIEELQLFIK